MRAVTIALLLALLGGCFPHNAKNRRYAKIGEGASIAAGILMLSVAGTGADCEAGPAGRAAYDDCRSRSTYVGNVGLGLILAGLMGFAITTMTAKDEAPPPTPGPLAATPPTTKPAKSLKD